MSKITVDIGKLDKRVTIQRHIVTQDEVGNEQQEWADYHSCWAAVNGVSNKEYWEAREQHEENTVNFKVRFCNKLSALNKIDYRIVFANRYYDITDIDNMLFADSLLNIKGVETE